MFRTRLLIAAALLPFSAALVAIVTPSPASAQLAIEDFAGYEPQSICSPWAKPGALALARWLERQYPAGRRGGISRACSSGGTSEHKEGRAYDWGVDVANPVQKRAAYKFLDLLFAPDRHGDPAALARRMGIMYVIFNDKIYGSYRGFEPAPYLNSSCKQLKGCSRTLRHKDHMHISLTRAGGWGQTSWYRNRGVEALPVLVPGTRKIDMWSTAYYAMRLPVDGSTVSAPFKVARRTPYTLYVQGLFRTGAGNQISDPVCTWDSTEQMWTPRAPGSGYGVFVNGIEVTATECNPVDHSVAFSFRPTSTDFLSLRYLGETPGNDSGALEAYLVQPGLVSEIDEAPLPVVIPEPQPAAKDGPDAKPLVREDVDVSARARRGTLTTLALRAGQRYAVTVRGVAEDGNTAFDAECVEWRRNWRYQHTQNLTAPDDDHLDLYLAGVDLDLRPPGGTAGECAVVDHVYRTVFTAPVSGQARIQVWDPNDYADNSGVLSVRIKRLDG